MTALLARSASSFILCATAAAYNFTDDAVHTLNPRDGRFGWSRGKSSGDNAENRFQADRFP